MNVTLTIEANNAAVSCICQGKLSEACALLVGSIRSMRSQLLVIVETADTLTEALKHPFEMGITRTDTSLQSVSVLSLISYEAFQKRIVESSPLAVFDRVYRIRSTCTDNQNLISAAILYNMAMAFHLEILSGTCFQTAKVERLYQMCDVIAQECKSSFAEASLLTLAALNNTAHLNSMHLKAQETSQSLDDLVSELTLLDREVSIMDDDLLVFKMNAFLHSTGQGFRTAPSA
jgi:hypothetical protein